MILRMYCVAAMGVLSLGGALSTARAENDPLPQELVVSYNSAQSITVPINDGISTLVGVQPDQVVEVTVRYSPTQALQAVNLEALDGGDVLPPSAKVTPPNSSNPTAIVPIGVDGALTFIFVAGHTPGLNQVSLLCTGVPVVQDLQSVTPSGGQQEVGLQFWVLNQETPEINPPAATADNPSY